MRRAFLAGVTALALGLPTVAVAQEPIRIGILVALEGAFAEGGRDGIRGIEMALRSVNNQIAGRRLETVIAPTDTRPDTAVRQARKLIEQDRVDFIIGPLSGSEGIAIRDHAKTQPDKTFINGASGALETTWVDPAPNFFRFHTHGLQWGAGLGEYVVRTKGWRRIATVAADYSFGHTNFMGFAIDFCRAGGDIVRRFWVPLGAADYGAVIAQLPDDVDAIYLGLGGTDAINFLNQYAQAGSKMNFIGGTIMADQTVLTSRGRAREALIGTPTSGMISDENPDPAWQAFVRRYRESYPEGQRFPSPTIFATAYHISTMAALEGLKAVNGDLSGGQRAFQAALARLELDTPLGKIRLDETRQAIGPVFVNEVAQRPDGSLYNRMVKRVDNVSQTLGLPVAEFRALGMPGRDTPDCARLRRR
ncbi:ABC transporter substrate-binding protein [Elioraea thermophila]|uniref:ABC transporter substrate-binding protein n=1 Tax=Elioraea thermophila TaxID=2185104 RepID=UPI000DF292F5|nr:ABC transporter substrate-binding protein [Elioraea thermophila]